MISARMARTESPAPNATTRNDVSNVRPRVRVSPPSAPVETGRPTDRVLLCRNLELGELRDCLLHRGVGQGRVADGRRQRLSIAVDELQERLQVGTRLVARLLLVSDDPCGRGDRVGLGAR